MERELPATEIRHIESMIAGMRVNELQSVLSMFRMPKLGKKSELIQRCSDLLRTPNQKAVATQVKLIATKCRGAAAPYPAPVRSYVPNGGMMNGNANTYGGYRIGQIYPMNRPMKNLVLMDLPFYDCHQTLLEPMELPAVLSGVKTQMKQSFTFCVPRERLGCWSPTMPLPRFEIQLRFFNVPAGYNSQELADDFPLNCVARVDEQIVQLPAVIPTNKPNVEPKRPSRPVDITQHCMNVRDHARPVRLTVEWTGDKRVWAVGVFLVYRVTSDILRNRAIGTAEQPSVKEPVNHYQEESVTRELIRQRLGGGNDDDIAMSQLKISLTCPLSRTRITLPARCKQCSHLQCFDLYNYLLMNEKRPTWRCPVCSGWAPYKLLIIDTYFQNVLTNVDAQTVEIELLMDGSYRKVAADTSVDVDSDDGDCALSNEPSGSGVSTTMKPAPSSAVADVIVLSDSDDEDEEAISQAIQASISDPNKAISHTTTSTPRSRDSSVIILDDESPPRPTPVAVHSQACSSSSLPSLPVSDQTSTAAFASVAHLSSSISSSNDGGILAPTPSRLAAVPTHSILSAHQNIYNNNPASLPYYSQSQWSQQSVSRTQYPSQQSVTTPTLNAGGSYPMTSYQQQYGNILGRFQASNPNTNMTFNYAAALQQQATSTFPPGTNLQEVLASLVQNTSYQNGSNLSQ